VHFLTGRSGTAQLFHKNCPPNTIAPVSTTNIRTLIAKSARVTFLSEKKTCPKSLLLDANAFKYGSMTWNQSSGENALTGSSWSFKASKGSGDLFNFVDNSNNLVFKATQEKMFVFGAVDGNRPTPVAGGLIYSGSNAWYLGYENDPI